MKVIYLIKAYISRSRKIIFHSRKIEFIKDIFFCRINIFMCRIFNLTCRKKSQLFFAIKAIKLTI